MSQFLKVTKVTAVLALSALGLMSVAYADLQTGGRSSAKYNCKKSIAVKTVDLEL